MSLKKSERDIPLSLLRPGALFRPSSRLSAWTSMTSESYLLQSQVNGDYYTVRPFACWHYAV